MTTARFTAFDVKSGKALVSGLDVTDMAGYLARTVTGGKSGVVPEPGETINYRHLGMPALEDAGVTVILDHDARFVDMSAGQAYQEIAQDMDSRYELYAAVAGRTGAKPMVRDTWERTLSTERSYKYAAYPDGKDPIYFENSQSCEAFLSKQLETLPEAERFELSNVFYDGLGPAGSLGIPGLDRLGIRVTGSEGLRYTSDFGGEHALYSRLCERFGRTPMDLRDWSYALSYEGYVKESETSGVDLEQARYDFSRAYADCAGKDRQSVMDRKYVEPGARAVPALSSPYTEAAFRENLTARAEAAEALSTAMDNYRADVVPDDSDMDILIGGDGIRPVSKFDYDAYHQKLQSDVERTAGFVLTGMNPGWDRVYSDQAFHADLDRSLMGVCRPTFSPGGLSGAVGRSPETGLPLYAIDQRMRSFKDSTLQMLEAEDVAAMRGGQAVGHIDGKAVYTDDYMLAFMSYACGLRAYEHQAMAARAGSKDGSRPLFEDGMFPKDMIAGVAVDKSRPWLVTGCRTIMDLSASGETLDLTLRQAGQAAMLEAAPVKGITVPRRRNDEISAKASEIEAGGMADGAGHEDYGE